MPSLQSSKSDGDLPSHHKSMFQNNVPNVQLSTFSIHVNQSNHITSSCPGVTARVLATKCYNPGQFIKPWPRQKVVISFSSMNPTPIFLHTPVVVTQVCFMLTTHNYFLQIPCCEMPWDFCNAGTVCATYHKSFLKRQSYRIFNSNREVLFGTVSAIICEQY